MEKISIIIPAYNAEKTIERCIDSLISQTYENIEIIVVNDGSRDNTASVCQKYKKDPRFLLIDKENGGVSDARNTGIDKSTGEYIAFVDADDYVPVDAVYNIVNIKEKYKVELVCASYRFIKSRNRSVPFLLNNNTYNDKEYIDNIYTIVHSVNFAPFGKIFDAKIIKENNIKFPAGIPNGEDAVFLFEYLKYIRSVRIDDSVVYNYDISKRGSLSRSYCQDIYCYIHCVYEAKKNLLKFFGFAYLQEYEEKNNVVEFEKCLEHYLIYEHNKAKLNKYILLSAEKFNISDTDTVYAKLLKEKKLFSIAKIYFKNNYKYIIKQKIINMLNF